MGDILDVNTFTKNMMLSGFTILSDGTFAIIDITAGEMKLCNSEKIKTYKDNSRLKIISSTTRDGNNIIYKGNIIVAYKVLVKLNFQEEIDII